MFKKLTLAAGLLACGILTAQAEPVFIATAGTGALQVQGFGLSSTAPAVTVTGGVADGNGGFGLSASATVTGNLSAPGLSGRYVSAQAQATYSYRPTQRLTVQPAVEYGYDGFRGALATQHAAYGLGVGYMLTPTVGVSAQVLHGRTTAGGADGETGQYQAASLYLLAAAPFDLPGNLALSYSQRRWFAAGGPQGDNYLRTRQLMFSYTRTF